MTQEFIIEGRIVWGHPTKGQKAKNMKTGQPKLNKNNQEYDEFAFGVATPVAKFNETVWPSLYAEAAKFFPNGVPADFAWKFKQETDLDKNKKLYSEYEGRAGCTVLAIKSASFPPPIYKINPQTGAYDQIEGDAVKCGDWVAVKCTVEFNGSNGVYINPQTIIHIGYDTEIRSSNADPEGDFAGYTPDIPAHVSATPTMGLANMPAMPAAPQYAQPAMPTAVPPPAHDYVAQATGQPVPAAPASAPQYAQPAAMQTPPAMPAAPASVPGVPAAAPTAVPGQPPAMPGVPPTGLR